MPCRTPWDPELAVGHPLIDAQHETLLADCARLADHCDHSDSPADERAFDEALERLKVLAREHFEAEAALLAAGGDVDAHDHRIECDEFEYLAGEVATVSNFARAELQRFLALWCLGHVRSSAQRLRELRAAAGE